MAARRGFSGSTITPYDDTLPSWLWKTGGYTGFSNKISELTSNGTCLTFSAPHDLLFLADKSGRTFEGCGTPGLGLLVLPLSVTGDTQTAGVLAAELQAFGALAWAENNGFGARIIQIHFFLF
ncbi:hypothetical protein [Escherichia coli]|uniref:hypothetical protein n=1 Tax=Escherichia coli TaxID=562 RepID=UPI0038B535A4